MPLCVALPLSMMRRNTMGVLRSCHCGWPSVGHWRDAACRRVSAAPLYAELRATSDDQIAFNSKSAAKSSAINDSQLSSLKYSIHFTLSYTWRVIRPEGGSKIYYNQFVKCLEDLIRDYTTWWPCVPMTKKGSRSHNEVSLLQCTTTR